MPNWCLNRLTITGPAETLERFLAVCHAEETGEVEDLALSVVAPEVFGEYRDAPTQAVLDFQTAHQPPRSWLRAVSRAFPGLTLRLAYNEPLVGYRGQVTARGGRTRTVRHDVYDLETATEDERHAPFV